MEISLEPRTIFLVYTRKTKRHHWILQIRTDAEQDYQRQLAYLKRDIDYERSSGRQPQCEIGLWKLEWSPIEKWDLLPNFDEFYSFSPSRTEIVVIY